MADLICIDPGHGGRDPGSLSGNRKEALDNLKFAKALAIELQSRGLRTLLTRSNDTYHTLSERVRISNNARPKYFVSIHRNCFSSPHSNGSEVWIYHKPKANVETLAQNLAWAMNDCGFRNRGVKKTETFRVVTDTVAPAFLLELGFISNAKDNSLFDSQFSSLVTKIANALAPGATPLPKKCGACGQTLKG